MNASKTLNVTDTYLSLNAWLFVGIVAMTCLPAFFCRLHTRRPHAHSRRLQVVGTSDFGVEFTSLRVEEIPTGPG